MGKPKSQRWRGKYYLPDPNEPDDVIINQSINQLNISKDKLDELLTNSKKTRRFKRQERLERFGIIKNKKAPRPQNRFIIYKRYKLRSPEFKNRPKKERKVEHTSKEIGLSWQNETEEIIKVFCALERRAEEIHREIYGDDYKFEKSQRKGRKTKNKKESSISSDCSSTESSPYYQASQSSDSDSISSNISLHALEDSISPNLSLQNQNMMNDDALEDSVSPNQNQNTTVESHNHYLTNCDTLGDSAPPNQISQNQNIMDDGTIGLINCDILGNSASPNLISQNQNIMNDATFLTNYSPGDSTLLNSTDYPSTSMHYQDNLTYQTNYANFPLSSNTQQFYYLVDYNTLCYLQQLLLLLGVPGYQ